MKKLRNNFTIMILAITALFTVGACELETSDAGRLTGFWQLRTLDSLSTGRSTDMRPFGVAWSFQSTIMQVQSYQVDNFIYLSYEHNSDRLRVFAPLRADRKLGDDVPLQTTDTLHMMGIPAIETIFTVKELSGSTMVLQTDSLRLQFRKY